VPSRAQINQAQLDSTQMFQLLDTVLCFEACLYHQVLPLSLEEKCLKLGMVNPEDNVALDYISRILSHLNYSLVSQPIASNTHRTLLSAYLNYREKSKPATELGHTPLTTPKQSLASSQREWEDNSNQNDRPTLILIDPSEPTDDLQSQPEASFNQVTPAMPVVAPLPLNSASLVLQLNAAHLSSPVKVLATLPPKNLLQELLGRVLEGGIGRLYFERQSPEFGRILWSRDGVLQSVLEELPWPIFCEAINELKQLASLPLTSVEATTQVEIDCLYQEHNLLLRLQVMPGTHGEQATLQVLRGAALKFYQQQQVAHLSRDALVIAQQLLHKVNELKKRTQSNTGLKHGQLEAPPALNELLESIEQINGSIQASGSPTKTND